MPKASLCTQHWEYSAENVMYSVQFPSSEHMNLVVLYKKTSQSMPCKFSLRLKGEF